MIHQSRPSPWVRPGWYVALCVTDGANEPQGWDDTRRRDSWAAMHTLSFPEHDVHQFHAAGHTPPRGSAGNPLLRNLISALRLLGRARDLLTSAAGDGPWRTARKLWCEDYDRLLADGDAEAETR